MRLNRFRITIALLSLSVVFICLQAFVFHRNELVYVDSAKLLNGYKGMIEARKEFEKKNSVWKANIDTLTADVKNAITKYSKDLAYGTDKEKSLSKELIQNKQRELYDYQTATKQNASQEEDRLNQQVFTTINAFLQNYGKKSHFKLILVASNGNIAYADPGMDITDKIISELNTEYLSSKKQ